MPRSASCKLFGDPNDIEPGRGDAAGLSLLLCDATRRDLIDFRAEREVFPETAPAFGNFVPARPFN
jgi:hypothetical protein